MNPSDEIKAKLDVVDVLREYIQLKPAGVNFRANCPFHHEKSPSFMVSPEKQIWHCFGCGKGGDIFSFVMEMEGLTFSEALRVLAPKAGVELKKENPELNSQRNRLLDLMQLSAKYYNFILKESKLAENARDYLKRRGLSEETIDEWQIGYSTESWDDLVNFLKSRGFRDNEISLAGMSSSKPGTNRYYNRFRGRIMFPISDFNGNVVAFTARVRPEREAVEQMGKYVNSPQTMIYDKSKILFGLDKAKAKIRNEDLAIIVEGQMDVITAHQHGFRNIVASSGTALTADQMKLIERYTHNIAFALDADDAGKTAIGRGETAIANIDYREIDSEDARGKAQRYIDYRNSYNFNIKIIEIPNGKDPDECIKNDPQLWQKAVNEAKDIMQFYFNQALSGVDLENIEQRRRVIATLLPKIAKLGEKDKTEQDFWLKKLSQALDADETALRLDLVRHSSSETAKNYANERVVKSTPLENKPKNREELLGELLLALILKFPEHLPYVLNNLQLDQLAGDHNKALYKSLVIYYNNVTDNQVNNSNTFGQEYGETYRQTLDYKSFRDWLAQEQIGNAKNLRITDTSTSFKDINQPVFLDRLALLAEKDFFEYEIEQAKREIITTVASLKKHYLQSRLKEIERLIVQLEKEKANDKISGLMEEFKLLLDELKEVDRINQ